LYGQDKGQNRVSCERWLQERFFFGCFFREIFTRGLLPAPQAQDARTTSETGCQQW
jgi:hypothetical protein